MWLADKLSNFLAGFLSKQIGRTEAALAAARGNPNVSLQEVKKVEKTAGGGASVPRQRARTRIRAASFGAGQSCQACS